MARPIEILLVEDSPGDVELTRLAMKEGRVANRLHVVTDGEQALDFLYRRGPFQDAIVPDLILLDLNLPKVNGREVLAQLKADEALRSIPVVVLTTSTSDEDIVRSYAAHANSYVQKPVDYEQFIRAIQQIQEYWLMFVWLPPHTS
jgi:two-component system, chemotaxis family, response regulator Rcp1